MDVHIHISRPTAYLAISTEHALDPRCITVNTLVPIFLQDGNSHFEQKGKMRENGAMLSTHILDIYKAENVLDF